MKHNIHRITGLIDQKSFPFLTSFWRVTNKNNAYFIGTSWDIGMDPAEVSKCTLDVLRTLSNITSKKVLITVSIGKNTAISSKDDLGNMISQLTTNLESDWYADKVAIAYDDNDFTLYLESFADGSELFIFIYGEGAEQIYMQLKGKIT